MSVARRLWILPFLFLAAGLAQARYAAPDLVEVPVDRLIANLERQLAGEPPEEDPGVPSPGKKKGKPGEDTEGKADWLHRLARLHAIAWAQKSATVQINRRFGGPDPWFGHEPAHLPWRVTESQDAEVLKTAQAHLEKAIATYAQAVELAPANLVARLGQAWVLDQAGKREEAIAGYRRVVEEGWAQEGTVKEVGLGFHSIVEEAAGYLKPLLDPEKDAAELRTLEERVHFVRGLQPREVTPIAVGLRPDLGAAEVVDRASRVRFDLDGTRTGRVWEWITPDAAWLVRDARGEGRVESGLQLFGNVSYWVFWDDGYQALRALDDDGDGRLTGAELTGLALWRDGNRDGVSDPGEVRPLEEWGVTALECLPVRGGDGLLQHAGGAVLRDGARRPTWDLVLRSR